MTFEELQSEIISMRFTEAQRGFVKNWINNRYQLIWAAEDWRFKTNVRYTTPIANPGQFQLTSLPTDISKVRALHYEKSPVSPALPAISPREFAERYEQSDTIIGEPEAYTVRFGTGSGSIGPEIWVGPTPASLYEFVLYYDRRLAKKRSVSIVAGPMEQDDDEPLWPTEWHHILVPAAMALGLKLEQDPGWADVQDDFMTQLQQMREELFPDDGGAGLVYRRELW